MFHSNYYGIIITMKLLNKIYNYIFILSILIPTNYIYACVGGERSTLDKLVGFGYIPVWILLNIIIIRKIKKKLTLILFIIFFNIFMVLLWAAYGVVTSTFC